MFHLQGKRVKLGLFMVKVKTLLSSKMWTWCSNLGGHGVLTWVDVAF